MSSLPTPSEPRDTSERWVGRIFMLVIVLACALALSKNLADPDFWGHVQYGRDALQSGLPSVATYTYSAAGHRWINHEVLSEYLMAIGVETIGQAGMLIVKSLLGLLVLALMWRSATAQGVRPLAICVCLLLVVTGLMHFWALRPQLLSFVLFALMITLLDRCFPCSTCGTSQPAGSSDHDAAQLAHWQAHRNQLWWLVPLFFVWANSHGGFVAGYCILGAYFAGRGLQGLARWGRPVRPVLVIMGLVLLAAGAATLLNPYGIALHGWLLQSLGSPRPEIVEWRPPELISIVWLPWWIVVATFLAAVFGTRLRRDPVQLTLLTLTLWQACAHRRHIAFFAILFGFWMPVHVQSLIERFRSGAAGRSVAERPRLARWLPVAGLVAASIFIGAALVSQLRAIPVRKDGYPVAAFQFMADRQLEGRLVVRFKWAQYAIAAFGCEWEDGGRPRIQVAFDGRFRTCYPQEIVDMYFDFAKGHGAPGSRHRSPHSPPLDPTRILEFRDPNLVLIDRQQEHAVSVMHQQEDDWVLLYQDSMAQLWGRRAIYDNADDPRYLPPAVRRITNDIQSGVVAWPALPETQSETERLARQQPQPRSKWYGNLLRAWLP